MSLRNLWALCLGLSVTSLLVGCGGAEHPPLGYVTGKITIDGQPAPRMTVRFVPTDAGSSEKPASPSLGATDAEGNYKLFFSQDTQGAMLGTHDVFIEPLEQEQDEEGNPIGTAPVKLPAKYQKAGTLTAEVKEGKNTVNFNLDSK